MKVKKTASAVVLLAMILSLLVSLVSLSVPVQVSAAVSFPSVNYSSYLEFKAEKTIYVYTTSSCTTRGTASPYKSYGAYIDKGDVCYVYAIDNSLYVRYPTAANGYRYGYIRRGDVFPSSPSEKFTAKANATTYSNGSSYGTVETGDEVYLCGESNGYYRLIYSARSASTSRGWKLGYLKKDDYNRVNPSSSGSDSSQVVLAHPAEGDYVIVPVDFPNFAIDLAGGGNANPGTFFQIWSRNGTIAQTLTLKRSGDSYRIIYKYNGLVMNLQYANPENDARIWAYYSSDYTNASLWNFHEIQGNPGVYVIQSKSSGKVLDLHENKPYDSAILHMWDFHAGHSCRWKLIPVGNTSSNTENNSHVAYTGVNYKALTTNSYRLAALSLAESMTTLVWRAPCDFRTWCSKTGGYNWVKATDGTRDTYFRKGKTYTGIPYSMANRSYTEKSFISYLNSNSQSSAYETTYYSHNKKTTRIGIDCSYFVTYCLNNSGSSKKISDSYSTTSTMLKSGLFSWRSYQNMKPGDIFLNSGHVMMYVGKTSNGSYAVFESDADDSKCSYNEYSATTLSRGGYSGYTFTGYGD